MSKLVRNSLYRGKTKNFSPMPTSGEIADDLNTELIGRTKFDVFSSKCELAPLCTRLSTCTLGFLSHNGIGKRDSITTYGYKLLT